MLLSSIGDPRSDDATIFTTSVLSLSDIVMPISLKFFKAAFTALLASSRDFVPEQISFPVLNTRTLALGFATLYTRPGNDSGAYSASDSFAASCSSTNFE